ncbi:hypothetical protein WH50_10865 [Pokkaliibacter plantistimulans]|uniref:Thioesterase domain-containing protein n=2 Tax=Pokkaliibacter plantistimulans TaxID=1635171 RepID=A0ABX5LXC6_9GAMM|nr:hypothetical protein WH50_10865 [Pokkaliibacter plantistimulans]
MIGGGADKSDALTTVVAPTRLVEREVMPIRKAKNPGVSALYYGHEDYPVILASIQADLKLGDIVNITGHSWGGGAAIRLAQALKVQGKSVNVLITLDPVSLLPLTSNVAAKTWVNVYQRQSFIDAVATVPVVGNAVAGVASALSIPFSNTDFDDTVATVGGQLGYQNKASINQACDLHHGQAGLMYRLALETLKQNGKADH